MKITRQSYKGAVARSPFSYLYEIAIRSPGIRFYRDLPWVLNYDSISGHLPSFCLVNVVSYLQSYLILPSRRSGVVETGFPSQNVL